MKFLFTLEPPWEWIVLNAKGQVADAATVDALEEIKPPRGVSEIIGIAPGQAVTIRRAEVPGKRRSHVEAAMPYALEESLSEDVEELHFTLLDWQPGESALVAIVSKDLLAGWVGAVQSAGIRMDRVVPGYLLLPRYDDTSVTISPVAGNPSGGVYIRDGQLSGCALEAEFLPLWFEEEGAASQSISVTERNLALQLSRGEDARVRHWDIGQSHTDWLRLSRDSQLLDRLNLLHGAFVPAHRSRNYGPLKVALALGVLAALSMYAGMIRESKQLNAENSSLNRAMTAVFKERFPGEPWLGRPRFQVEALLNAAGPDSSAAGFSSLLQAVTTVARQHRAEIEEVNYRNDAMIVLCNVSGLSVLDDIRAGLEALPGVTAELLSSGARDSQVTGRFRLSRG